MNTIEKIIGFCCVHATVIVSCLFVCGGYASPVIWTILIGCGIIMFIFSKKYNKFQWYTFTGAKYIKKTTGIDIFFE